MRRLRIALAALALQLLLFYGFEHFSQGTSGALSLSPVSYVAGILGVVLLIAFPPAATRPAGVWVAAVIAAYLGARVLLTSDPPLVGGAYTYLTLAECVLIAMVVSLAHTVDRNLRRAEELVATVGFSGYDGVVVPGGEHPEVIKREITRSRRYSRALSVVLVVPSLQQAGQDPAGLFREFSHWLIRRRVNNQLALLIREGTRRNDLLFEWQGRDELIVMCPETDRQQVGTVIRKIQMIAAGAGMRILAGFASFPDDALTFDELVTGASKRLAGADLPHGVVVTGTPARPASRGEATDGLTSIRQAQPLMTERQHASWSNVPYMVNESTDDHPSGFSDHSQ